MGKTGEAFCRAGFRGATPASTRTPAAAVMALLPPVAVILFMQRWFVTGLIEAEK